MLTLGLLLLAPAAQPPIDVNAHARRAQLFAPGPPRTLGAVTNTDLRLALWLSPTRVKVDHKGPAYDFAAEVDLAQEHTYVEIAVPAPRLLAGTEPWTLVISPRARIPLVAGGDAALELGFRSQDGLPVTHATLLRAPGKPPEATGPVEKCPVTALHVTAAKDGARWEIPSPAWAVHRPGKPKNGWRKAWAEWKGITVHGFVHDRDVKCPPPKPDKDKKDKKNDDEGDAEPTGGDNEGTAQAREAKLPVGTRMFATSEAQFTVVVLHKPARGLQRDDGSWILPSLQQGKERLELRGLFMPAVANLGLGPPQIVTIGSSFPVLDDWPRRRQQD